MGKFQMAPDAVPVERIPLKTLSNGVKIPSIGLGTFGSDHASGELVANTVREALRLGYRARGRRGAEGGAGRGPAPGGAVRAEQALER